MSKVTASADFDRVPEDKLTRYLAIFGDDVLSTLNGGLDFETNFNAKIVTVTFSSTSADVAVTHGLGRAPVGYIPLTLSADMTIYTGSSPGTSSLLYLRSSATGTAKLLIF